MKYSLTGTNVRLTPQIRKYVEEKIATLDKFVKSFVQEVTAAIEVGKETAHHRTGKIWRAEVTMKLPKKPVRAVAVEKNIFSAITKVKDKLQVELKRYKEEYLTKKRRGLLRLKDYFRRNG